MSETVYTSDYQPDLSSALDVLAFVLTPTHAFTSPGQERAEVEAVLLPAKRDAIVRWFELQKGRP